MEGGVGDGEADDGGQGRQDRLPVVLPAKTTSKRGVIALKGRGAGDLRFCAFIEPRIRTGYVFNFFIHYAFARIWAGSLSLHERILGEPMAARHVKKFLIIATIQKNINRT